MNTYIVYMYLPKNLKLWRMSSLTITGPQCSASLLVKKCRSSATRMAFSKGDWLPGTFHKFPHEPLDTNQNKPEQTQTRDSKLL